MKQLKKSPRQQLEKFSTIFMHLGLVLVMFIVFMSLEHETEQTAIVIDLPESDMNESYTLDKPFVFVRDVVKTPQIRVELPVTTIIENPEVVENIEEIIETVITKDPDETIPDVEVTNVKEIVLDEVIDETDDPTPIGLPFVSKIPVFKGCENLTEAEGRKCLDKKMNKLVNRYFNASLGDELGLKSGKHKILTQFVIDKTGKVTDIQIRAPHTSLKREANRVVNKIPEFTPGENNGKPVNVRYTLPISFHVE